MRFMINHDRIATIRSRGSGNRRGALHERTGSILSMELLFVLPVMLLLVLAMVEMTFLIAAETRLAAASREGARIAALGGDAGDIQDRLDALFGSQSSDVAFIVTFLNDSQNPGDPVQVEVSGTASAFAPNYLKFAGFDLARKTLTARTVMTVE